MQLEIIHKTKYLYSSEVFLEPHHLYLYPSERNYFRVNDFDIKLTPESSGIAFRIDAENNSYFQCWFNQQITTLDIETKILITTFEINPFNFLQESEPKVDHKAALKIYEETVELSSELKNWVNVIRKPAGENLITFLSFLNKEINSTWEHENRFDEIVLHPNACFEQKNASCRDLAWMMIQMLRNEGIASRFVSGYSFNPELKVGHELHAWVEAWIPGAGWIGLDPSSGLLATDQYIPLATSYKPEHTLPVQGNFRGDATSELTFEVQIKVVG